MLKFLKHFKVNGQAVGIIAFALVSFINSKLYAEHSSFDSFDSRTTIAEAPKSSSSAVTGANLKGCVAALGALNGSRNSGLGIRSDSSFAKQRGHASTRSRDGSVESSFAAALRVFATKTISSDKILDDQVSNVGRKLTDLFGDVDVSFLGSGTFGVALRVKEKNINGKEYVVKIPKEVFKYDWDPDAMDSDVGMIGQIHFARRLKYEKEMMELAQLASSSGRAVSPKVFNLSKDPTFP